MVACVLEWDPAAIHYFWWSRWSRHVVTIFLVGFVDDWNLPNPCTAAFLPCDMCLERLVWRRSFHTWCACGQVGLVVLAPIFLVEFECDQFGLVSLIFATIHGACVRAQLVLELLLHWGDAPRVIGGVAHVC